MDSARFDRLALSVAAAPSRRALVKALVGAGLAGIAARFGAAPAAALVCPPAVPCAACDFDATAGTLDCANACADATNPAELCLLADTSPHHQALSRHLDAAGYRTADGAEAAVIRIDGDAVMAVLALPLVHGTARDRSAVLALIRGTTGDPLVYAFLREGEAVVAALSVDAAGEVQIREAPPSVPGTPSPGTPVAGTGLRAGAVRAQVPPDPCRRCDWCDYLCSGFGPTDICGLATLVVCAESLVGGPKAAITCGIVFTIFCNLVFYSGCEVICGAIQCAACDPGCANRDAADCGGCIDACPSRTAGTICCNGQCVDEALLLDDPANCGGCGNPCSFPRLVCCNGTCCGQSPLLEACCSGACVSLVSPAHCGACDNACPEGQVCRAPTTATEQWCNPCRRDGQCGPCERCEAGRCVSACLPPKVCVNGECVDEPCPNGGEVCPRYVYGCCGPDQFCCPDQDYCCDVGCICCGDVCCCGGLQCSEEIGHCQGG